MGYEKDDPHDSMREQVQGGESTASEVQEGSAQVSYDDVRHALRQRSAEEAAAQIAEPSVRYAGFWIRFLAYVIDAIVLGVVQFLFPLLFDLDNSGRMNLTIASIFTVLNFIYMLFMTYVWGQTLGKMACGIVVVPLEGGPRSFLFIFLRETVLRFISSIIFMIGYIIAAFHPKKQGLHDMLAKTVVVYRS
jgi:uncharacterized RDD family membrane protein YckC